MVDEAPFLEGMIPRAQSIEGREMAEKEDKIHRNSLRQKVR